MRRIIWFFLLVGLHFSVRADVEISGEYSHLFYLGGSERAGALSMAVTGNDFPDASPDTPVFVRLNLDQNVTLANTLVDQQSEQEHLRLPIFLALATENNDPSLRVAASTTSVSIVRWVKGEQSFWLRIMSSSQSWLEVDGELQPPSPGLELFFIIGIPGPSGAALLASLPKSSKNLPFNSRIAQPVDDMSLAQDTTLRTNLSNSTLTPSGRESELYYDVKVYNHTADQGNGRYLPGDELPVKITGSFTLGRSAGPTRFMPHITRLDSGFSSQLSLANLSDSSLSWHLTGVNADGSWLANAEGVLAGKETRLLDVENLFPDQNIAWIAISSEASLKVSIRYRAKKADSGWADVHEPDYGRVSGRLWRIYPGKNEVTWDGAAMVNVGTIPTSLRLIHRDENGLNIDVQQVDDALEPGGKRVVLFSDFFQAVPGSYYEIESDLGVAVTSLRGDLSLNFLWENPALLIIP